LHSRSERRADQFEQEHCHVERDDQRAYDGKPQGMSGGVAERNQGASWVNDALKQKEATELK